MAISRLTARSTEALVARWDLEMILMATFSPETLCMPSLTRPVQCTHEQGNKDVVLFVVGAEMETSE